jgi:hypothetical protein
MEVVFQSKLKGERPDDVELNYYPIFIDNVNSVPQMGDYLEFEDRVGGKDGIYKVISRYFQYFYHRDENEYNIRCNIVVERDDAAAPRLIKQ